MKHELPECPHCDSNLQPSLIAFTAKRDHIIEVWLCDVCSRSFEVRVNDAEDPRLKQLRG